MRRHDLDWVRIGAFALLIFYHIGMYYVPWDFHVKNEPTYTWLEIPMLFINQWRLPLLFLIAGMGAHFSLRRRTGKQFISERFVRLLVPLAFGMLVIVPPQVYVERVLEGDFTGSFWAFYPDYFVGIYPTGNFSWHHLWFLPYLFMYALLLCPLFVYCKKHPNSMFFTFFSKLVQSRVGLLLLSLPLILTHLFLRRLFPITHNLVYDWYNFIYLLLFFFYGYLFVSVGQVFWKSIAVNKKILFYFTILVTPLYLYLDKTAHTIPFHYTLFCIAKGLNTSSWLLLILAYTQHHLNKPSTLLSYLNEAVYPFYLVHQTILLILIGVFYKVLLTDWLEFHLLLAGTLLGSWGIFELVRRNRLLRPLFGLKTYANTILS